MVDGPDTMASIQVRGEYPAGSEGNEHGNAITAFVRKVVRESEAKALLLDFSELRYEYGDAIGSAFVHPSPQGQSEVEFLPCAVVASGRTKKSLISLLIDFGRIDSYVSLAFFEHPEEAATHLRAAAGSLSVPPEDSVP